MGVKWFKDKVVRALLLPRRRPWLKGGGGTRIGQLLETWVQVPSQFRRPFPKAQDANPLMGVVLVNEVRIHSSELIRRLSRCELRTSLGVPSNLDDGNTTSP
ncbi:hypothetical protein Tco_1218553 [Tanacetum coccineum]